MNIRQTVERWARARKLWPHAVAPSMFGGRTVVVSTAWWTLFSVTWEHVAVWALARETLGGDLPDLFLVATVSFVVCEDTLVKIDALQGSDHHALGELLASALHLWPQLPDDDPVKAKQVGDVLNQLDVITARVQRERADAAKAAMLARFPEMGMWFNTERLQDLRRRSADGGYAVDMIIVDDLVPPPPETSVGHRFALDGAVQFTVGDHVAEVPADDYTTQTFADALNATGVPARFTATEDGVTVTMTGDATSLATIMVPTKARDLPRRRHSDPPAHIGSHLARRLSRGAGRRSR